MKVKINEWVANPDELKAKAEGLTAKAWIEYGEMIASLDQLKDTVEDAREDLQGGINTAWQNVHSAFNDVIKKVK